MTATRIAPFLSMKIIYEERKIMEYVVYQLDDITVFLGMSMRRKTITGLAGLADMDSPLVMLYSLVTFTLLVALKFEDVLKVAKCSVLLNRTMLPAGWLLVQLFIFSCSSPVTVSVILIVKLNSQ